MASKASAPIVFLLALNLLFFTLVSSQSVTPMPAPAPSSCSLQNLDLGVCLQVLGLLSANITVGPNRAAPCCALLGGLVGTNVEIGVCLCPRIRNISIMVSALLKLCGKPVPPSFRCP